MRVTAAVTEEKSFATRALTPARSAVKVRRDAPLEFLGPLGCGLQPSTGTALNVMRPEPGKSFYVVWSGNAKRLLKL